MGLLLYLACFAPGLKLLSQCLSSISDLTVVQQIKKKKVISILNIFQTIFDSYRIKLDSISKKDCICFKVIIFMQYIYETFPVL